MTGKLPNWENLTTDQKLSLLHDSLLAAAGKLVALEKEVAALKAQAKEQ